MDIRVLQNREKTMEVVHTIQQERVQSCTVEANAHAPMPQVTGIVEVGQSARQEPVQNLTRKQAL